MSGVLAVVLAGGEGSRLLPLTISRSKPAVPYGGSYRLIDFVLNNLVNSNIIKIYVLTQFKSQSLYMHLKKGWNVSGIPGCFIEPIPAQMRMGKRWYDGTADSVYQNISFIQEVQPACICVFGSDHIYKMDVTQMLDFHKSKGGVLTVSAIRVPKEAAHRFGVIEVDQDGMMVGFEEKPQNPKTIPGDPGHCLVSMGNYIFNAETLYQEIAADAENPYSSHDFGKDIIPDLFPRDRVYVYDFLTNRIPGETGDNYWRDVGDLDTYWQSHMDILSDTPPFSLYNPMWPLHTNYPPLPPVKFNDTPKKGITISRSLISAGSEVTESLISRSVLGFECRISAGCTINDSVLLGETKIGEGCRLSRCIIDKDVEIAPGTILGEDPEKDRDRYSTSRNGIIVIPKGSRVGF